MPATPPDPSIPDPDRFRDDAQVAQGQDLGRAVTQMAEEDMAAAGDGPMHDEAEGRAHG